MSEIEIQVGQVVKDLNRQYRYRIIYIKGRRLVLCQMDIDTLELIYYLYETLIVKIMDKSFAIEEEQDKEIVVLESMSEKSKLKYLRNKGIVEKIIREYGPDYIRLSGKGKKPIIYEITQYYGISRSLFWRLCRRYLQSGFDNTSLLDKKTERNSYVYKKKPGRPDIAGLPLSQDMLNNFEEALNYYKSGRAKKIKSAFDYMNFKHYYDENVIGGVDSSRLLPVTKRPTYNQFYYYCRKNITQKEIDAIKTSKQEQRNNKRLLLSDSLKGVEGPGDLVEIDACEIDVSLASEVGIDQTIGRPIVYAMIDVYTRMVLAVSIAFDNNSNLGLTSLFLNLCDDKAEYCKKYNVELTSPDLWKSNIIPNRIRCDRGSDFKSKEIEKICNRLGIQRDLVSGGTGSLKGVVEQLFHQIHSAQNPVLENYGLMEKRYDSKHNIQSTLTLSIYTHILIGYIITHNQKYMPKYKLTKEMINDSIRPIPLILWNYGCEKYGSPRPIINPNQFMFDLMIEKKASLTRRGILFEGLYYLNMDDQQLLDDMFYVQNKSIDFIIRYDPRNVDSICYARNNKLYFAHLNKDITGNNDYSGMTFKEWEIYRVKKKQMDKEGKEYNENLDSQLLKIDTMIVDSAKKKRYSSNKNMRVKREEEKQRVANENNIEERFKEEHVTSNLEKENSSAKLIDQNDIQNEKITKQVESLDNTTQKSNNLVNDKELTDEDIAEVAQDFFDNY